MIEIKKNLVMKYSDSGITGDEFFSNTQKNLQIYKTESTQLVKRKKKKNQKLILIID